jgi:membrane associated rhomboid family serine protease
MHTAQGRRCWACAEAGHEHTFRVSALAEKMEGTGLSWWPPYGINCPPILWMFMDWEKVMYDCPAVFGYMALFLVCLMIRKAEERTGGWIPWTRCVPVFGPTLKRGEVWRFFTFTFFHLSFLDVFHNLLTLLDTLDVEGTPAIVLGDGSNLKCGVGAKQNFMCYPSIGMGTYHTLRVAVLSAAIGAMSSTWINFRGVVTGASALGFGLSGSIVALYGLYAGAELDQTTIVQRSFQDWVWLRLIFVAFHIAMEWIRGLSQKDVAGLFSHTAAFVCGFAYVLYFLPPMGDGTLLPSDRPYVVPCAYDIHGEDANYATDAVPECIRLFSQMYEYTLPDVQKKAFMMFVFSVGWTFINAFFVFGKSASATEAVLVAGMEVSAVCTKSKQGGQQSMGSNMEGQSIVLWCEVVDVKKVPAAASEGAPEMLMEVRCLDEDPRRDAGGLLDREPLKSSRTRNETGASAGSVEWREACFLPIKFSRTGHVQLVLRRAADNVALGHASLTMAQALRFNRRDHSEQKLKLQALGEGGAGGAVVHVTFRSLQPDELLTLRKRVKDQIDKAGFMQMQIQQQLLSVQQGSQDDGEAVALARASAAEDAENAAR